MLSGFILAPLSERPPPYCQGGDLAATSDLLCACSPRIRQSVNLKVPRGGTVKATNNVGIVSVTCSNNTEISWGGEHPTAADAQFRPFAANGAVFLTLIDGRVGRIITVVLNATHGDGTTSTETITLEVIE